MNMNKDGRAGCYSQQARNAIYDTTPKQEANVFLIGEIYSSFSRLIFPTWAFAEAETVSAKVTSTGLSVAHTMMNAWYGLSINISLLVDPELDGRQKSTTWDLQNF